MNIIALGELFDCAYRRPSLGADIKAIRRVVTGHSVLPLTESIMEIFGRNLAFLRRQATLVPDLDLLIAATALAPALTVPTRHRCQISRIPAIRLSLPQ